MELFIFLVINLVLIVYFNTEMDLIDEQPKYSLYYAYDWYVKNLWSKELWLEHIGFPDKIKMLFTSSVGWYILKNVLSFLIDGWHFNKFFMFYLIFAQFSLIICYFHNLNYFLSYVLAIGMQLIYGIIFNLVMKIKVYNSKFMDHI